MKVFLVAVLGISLFSGVAFSEGADGVSLLLEALRMLQGGDKAFEATLEEEVNALYLQGKYDAAMDRARLFVILGFLRNNEILQAHFHLFVARALSRQGKDLEAFTHLAQAYPVYSRRELPRYHFLTLETLIRVATRLDRWEEAKTYLGELEGLAAKLGGMYREMYLFHRGVVHFHENRFAEAKRDWQEAERMEAFFPETRGLTLNHLGRLFFMEGDAQKALEYAGKALALSEREHLLWVELVVRLNLAQILSEGFLEEDEALGHLERALQVAEVLCFPQGKVWVRNNQAVLFTRQGEYGKARKALEEALEIEESHHMPEDTGVVTNLGVLSFYLGDCESAERYLKRAYEEAFARNDQHFGAFILGNLGMLYKSMGKLKEALPYYEHAYRLLEELGARRDLANLLNSMASLNVMAGELSRAEEALRLARALYEALGDTAGLAQVEVNLGFVKIEQHDLDSAQVSFESALEKIGRDTLRSLAFFALLGLGEVALKRGEKEKAFGYLYEALDIGEKTRNRMEDITDRICFIQSRLAVYEFLMELLFEEGRIAEAFDLSERVKARSFLDVMVGQSVRVKAKDREVMERITAWEREKVLLEAKKNNARDQVTLWKVTEELAQVEKKLRFLYQELQASSPELLSFLTVSSFPLAEIQRVLPEDVVVLDYFVLPAHTLVWIVTASTLEGVDLPVGEDVLYEKVSLLREGLADPEKQDFVALSSFLGEALFAPLEGRLRGKKTILLIPHRSLSFLPFQALIRGGHYLVEEYRFFYAPSLNTYFFTLKKEKNPAGRFVGFGNPKFSDPRIVPLPGAEEEVREAGKCFDNPLLLFGEEATESALYRYAREVNILHLSTHGSANERSPLYSVILLAPDAVNDGFLFAGEIFALPLQADLVVLSACQTALGQYSVTEGLVGFTRSFLYAGASSLVASLWSVSDKSTKDLFVSFFHYLSEGLPKVEALWRAQIDVARQYPHPFHWAPFILIGRER